MSVRFDTREFSRTLKQYMTVTKRDLAESINQQGYSTGIAANRITTKAAASKIRAASKGGGPGGVPLMAMGINKKRKAAGLKGLRGPDMEAAMEKELKHRLNAVQFLRAGYFPVIAAFAKAIKKGIGENAAKFTKRYGDTRGGARVARPGVSVSADFFNASFAEDDRTNPGRVLGIATDGLQKALNRTVRSMKGYIESRLQRSANKITQRFLR